MKNVVEGEGAVGQCDEAEEQTENTVGVTILSAVVVGGCVDANDDDDDYGDDGDDARMPQ